MLETTRLNGLAGGFAAGKAVALRAAAKLGSEAEHGNAQENGEPGKATEVSRALLNQKRRYSAGTASVRAGSTAHAAVPISSRAEQPSPAAWTDSKRHEIANSRLFNASTTKAAGQQRAPAKSEWVPRGLAQQKQQRKFQNSKPAPLQLNIPLAAAAVSAAPAVDAAPTRKRSQGGRKRRKKAE